jgi:hypothetical protein
MDYSKLFYWLTVADNARTLFGWGAGIFTAIAVVATVVNIFARGCEFSDNRTEKELSEDRTVAKAARKWMLWSYPFMFLWWALLVFTPSKKDALLIVAGGQTLNFLTTDKTAKQIPHELSNFVVTELKNMAAEAKVDLNIKDQKQKILDEVENMSAKELMEKMKVDSTFAKIILDK